ncbi:manganese catalase family protein [Candidatus Bathyarchaeota archaeon]|nr:manganese catalase family protein [Candidatus Bathyarchaeota archaeon]
MVSQELLEMLNKAIAGELQVAIQYMWQHVLWKGVKAYAVKDELKNIAITEMKHAEAIAERLTYLGGIPTTKPDQIFVKETLKEMIEQDRNDEENAVTLYKQIIATANREGDITTARLFRKILEEEEQHHDFFASLLKET